MQVKSVKISNILNVGELEITPGRVTQITGGNNVGKTSVLSAVKSVFTGGHDATLLRNGEEQGETVIVFDNGDEIRKVVTSTKSDLKVRQDGKLVRTGATTLEAMSDIVSINPVEFMLADDKRRFDIILESLDLVLSDEDLSAAAGFDCKVDNGDVLGTIGAVRKSIYDNRTGLNRAHKEKKNTLDELSSTVPAIVVTGDSGSALMDLQTQLDQVNNQVRLSIEEYGAERDAKVADIVRQIQELEAQRNAINEEFAQRRLAKIEEGNALTAPIKAQMAVVAEQEQQRGRWDQQRAMIERMETELEELTKQITAASSALERMDALRLRLLSNLPFADLVLQDGKVYLRGIPFDRICTSDQVKFCMQLAVHRAKNKDIKLVCVDGLELIEGDRYLAFVAVAKQLSEAEGIQFFVTRVTQGPLTIVTE